MTFLQFCYQITSDVRRVWRNQRGNQNSY